MNGGEVIFMKILFSIVTVLFLIISFKDGGFGGDGGGVGGD